MAFLVGIQMRDIYCLIVASVGLVSAASTATAATESYTFDATLTSGVLLCGEAVGREEPCPELFGVIGEPEYLLDDLMSGLSIGGTYPGRIDLYYDQVGGEWALSDVTCQLNNRNCFFGNFDDPVEPPFLGEPPLGPAPGLLSLGDGMTFESRFNIFGDTGTYEYSTDYFFLPNDFLYYYVDVNFELSDVEFSPVPLPAGVVGLMTGLGAFGFLRRRRRVMST